MCPLQDYEEIDPAKVPLSRCSVCKNRFYCSPRCQKTDWKEHKWNCSALPVEGVPARTVVELDDEFKSHVGRVAGILREVSAALKDDKQKVSASMVAPLLKIPTDLPSHLQYTRAIQESEKFKYRLPILTACRLFLIDYVSTLTNSDPQRKEFEDWFAGMQLPASFCEMYGPKIVGSPADLSPGEYAMLAQTMPMWVVPKMDEEEEEKEGEGEGEDEEREGDKDEPAGRRWVWLALALRRAYGVHSDKTA
ncbi:hypothetical protein FB45DRAFT_1024367 [Roridomyces roridus]|uniref:MYND-type domain-containing protein n=1 Tax=Roridomyces roridus TaxID=1738132 RepID=A0AAD7FT51_9AGAR|nr:hypothetical protein FB45DRAFT_1024367 [Roridomyces roridus]